MSPEPAELQILKQILGDERGQHVFALNMMAVSLAQLSQQVQAQAQQLEALQQPPTDEPAATVAPSENPWTGPTADQPASPEAP